MLTRTAAATSPKLSAVRSPSAAVCELASSIAQALAFRCAAALGRVSTVPVALVEGVRFPGDGMPVAARPDVDYSRPVLETADGVLVFNAGKCAGGPAYEFLAPVGDGTWASYYTTEVPQALAIL